MYWQDVKITTKVVHHDSIDRITKTEKKFSIVLEESVKRYASFCGCDRAEAVLSLFIGYSDLNIKVSRNGNVRRSDSFRFAFPNDSQGYIASALKVLKYERK